MLQNLCNNFRTGRKLNKFGSQVVGKGGPFGEENAGGLVLWQHWGKKFMSQTHAMYHLKAPLCASHTFW